MGIRKAARPSLLASFNRKHSTEEIIFSRGCRETVGQDTVTEVKLPAEV